MSIEADTEIAAPTLVGSQHAASQTRLNKTANGSMRNEPPELRAQLSLPMPQALELLGTSSLEPRRRQHRSRLASLGLCATDVDGDGAQGRTKQTFMWVRKRETMGGHHPG